MGPYSAFAKIAEELAGPPLESSLHGTPTKYRRTPGLGLLFRGSARGRAFPCRRFVFFLSAPLLKYLSSQISDNSKVGSDGCTGAPSTETADAPVQSKVATRYTVVSGSLVGQPSPWPQPSLLYFTYYVFYEIS